MSKSDYEKRNADLLYKTIAGVGGDIAGAITARNKRKIEEEEAQKKALVEDFNTEVASYKSALKYLDKNAQRIFRDASLESKDVNILGGLLKKLGLPMGSLSDEGIETIRQIYAQRDQLEDNLEWLEQIQKPEDKIAYMQSGLRPLSSSAGETEQFYINRLQERGEIPQDDYYASRFPKTPINALEQAKNDLGNQSHTQVRDSAIQSDYEGQFFSEAPIKRREVTEEEKEQQNPFQAMRNTDRIYPDEPQNKQPTPEMETSKLLTSAVGEFDQGLDVNIAPHESFLQSLKRKLTPNPQPKTEPQEQIGGDHKSKLYALWEIAHSGKMGTANDLGGDLGRSDAMFERLYSKSPEDLERWLVQKAAGNPLASSDLRQTTSNAYADNVDTAPRSAEEDSTQREADAVSLFQGISPLMVGNPSTALGTIANATPAVAGQTFIDTRHGDDWGKSLAKNALLGYGIPLAARGVQQATGNYRLNKLNKDPTNVPRQEAVRMAEEGYPLSAAHKGDNSLREVGNNNSYTNYRQLRDARQGTGRKIQEFTANLGKKYEEAHPIPLSASEREIKVISNNRVKMAEKELKSAVKEVSKPIMEESNRLFEKAYQDIAKGHHKIELDPATLENIRNVVDRNRATLEAKYFKIGDKKLPKDFKDLYADPDHIPNAQEVANLLKNLDGYIRKGKGKITSQTMQNLVGFRNELLSALPSEGVKSLTVAKEFFKTEALGAYKANQLIRQAEIARTPLDIEQMFFKSYSDYNGWRPQEILFNQLSGKGKGVDPALYLIAQTGKDPESVVLRSLDHLAKKEIPEYFIRSRDPKVQAFVESLEQIKNEKDVAFKVSQALNKNKGSQAELRRPNIWRWLSKGAFEEAPAIHREVQMSSPEFLRSYKYGAPYKPRSSAGTSIGTQTPYKRYDGES